MSLVFLVVGASHRDPLPPYALIDLVKSLKQLGIPLLFADEQASDVSLAKDTQNYIGCLKPSDLILKSQLGVKVTKLMRKGTRYPAFPLAAWADLEQLLAPHFSDLQTVTRHLVNYSGYVGALALRKQLLKSNVKYIGMETHSAHHRQASQARLNSDVVFLRDEQSRIACMVKSIQSCLSLDEKDEAVELPSVVICSVGYLHAARLGANLQKAYADAQVHIVRCASHYCDDSIDEFRVHEAQMRTRDPADIQAIYATQEVTDLVQTDEGYQGEWSGVFTKVLKAFREQHGLKLSKITTPKEKFVAMKTALDALGLIAYPTGKLNQWIFVYKAAMHDAVCALVLDKPVTVEKPVFPTASAASQFGMPRAADQAQADEAPKRADGPSAAAHIP